MYNIKDVKKFMEKAKERGTITRINNTHKTIDIYDDNFNRWNSWVFLKDAGREYNHYFTERTY